MTYKIMKNRKLNLKLVISERLNLQSTKRALEQFRLPNSDFNYFQSSSFINSFNQWTDDKKKIFLRLMLPGGMYDKVDNSWENVVNKFKE